MKKPAKKKALKQQAKTIDRAIRSLQEEIATACQAAPPEVTIFIEIPATNEAARLQGWPDSAAMKEDISEALKILPAEIASRVVVEEV